ncbi:polyprotein [Drepanopeziza brunnea f. sp. 'multigermtubi' MB_m1]|uniref:Polyprotein n=1 Tax=Marssonina brunnea f. sp. multigermtubi (strain MB_m1) TaxID=1072389 RepID=K1WSZ0_MARBU|nr:polyprotein [Drepanopeziza brunnea f. sp. 'multigermtubi' MB_m1]EKD20760.1 polyprotein [Drepanopeziza brunnea f. sp. 'multigermtubi' MB_m1]
MVIWRALYGVPEAGTHCTFDPCLLLSTSRRDDFAIIGLQTDDTFILATDTFAAKEEDELTKAKLDSKSRDKLLTTKELAFNGGVLRQHASDNSMSLLQKGQGLKLKLVGNSLNFKVEYLEQRARAAYIASIGYTIILATKQDTGTNEIELQGNLVHYSSVKCSRVTKSVLASEVYGMVAGVDIAIAIGTTLAMVTKQLGLPTILVIILTDSYSLYKCLVKLGTTKEKRLMIDIMALRQSYERRELTKVRWIAREHNTADAMTKGTPNKALETFLDTNKLKVKLEGWVERES